MKPVKFRYQVEHIRRRAIELYSHDTPFRNKKEKNLKVYSRKIKHGNKQVWHD
jgi:stalled ribosome alternative rescue factor ArfA